MLVKRYNPLFSHNYILILSKFKKGRNNFVQWRKTEKRKKKQFCQIHRNEELPGGGAAGQDASLEIFYRPAIVSSKQNHLQPKQNKIIHSNNQQRTPRKLIKGRWFQELNKWVFVFFIKQHQPLKSKEKNVMHCGERVKSRSNFMSDFST